MDSHVTRARWRARTLALALALSSLGGLTALAVSTASEPADPYGSSDVNATIEQLAREAQVASSPPEPRSDGSESRAEAREVFEETFGGVVAEPETPLRLAPGAQVERYLGANAARIDSPGSLPDAVALSALPLRVENRSGELRPVDLALERLATSFAPENPLIDVTIPERLSDGVEVGSTGIALGPASGTQPAEAAIVENKAFYAEVSLDADWVVGPVATGVELLVQLRSPAAAERHVLDLELPPGATLLGASDGGVDVVREGELVARVLPPAATDAAGRPVPVGYELSGDDLTVVAAHRVGGFAYPILVDPVVEDWATDGQGNFTNGWFHNPDLDQLGWEFRASPNSRFEGTRQGTSVASYGTPPGRGLYVFGPPGLQRLLGDYGHWRWRAPGQTAYITRADFRTMYFEPAGLPFLPSAVAGLWDSGRSSFAGVRVYPSRLSGANATVRPGDGVAGADPEGADEAVFGMRVLGPNLALRWLHAYLGGAVIYLEDPEPASVTRFDVGTGWIGRDDAVTVEASDPGLGVRAIELQTPAGVHARTHPCLGDRLSRCPATWSQDFDVNLLPEGRIELTARTADVLGQASTSAPREARVDRMAPALELSGSLHEAEGGFLEEGIHTLRVRASDANAAIETSGVRSVELLVDGERRGLVEHDCPSGGCELDHSFELDATSLPEGTHEISVKAVDGARNESVEAFQVGVDRTAPGLVLSGELWERRAEWLESGTLSLAVAATDGASGVVSAELVIDGIRQEFEAQPCREGGCPLDTVWAVDVGALDEGRHLVQVLVLDASGRLRQEAWMALVDRSNPTIQLSGPLAELEGEVVPSGEHRLDIAASDPGSGIRSVDVLLDGDRVDFHDQPCEQGGCSVDRSWTLDTAPLDEGDHTVRVVIRDEASRQTVVDLAFEISSLALPEPPPLDRTRTTPVGEANSFLYEGPDAIQTGVAEEAIEPRRAAVLRGRVLTREGGQVAGATVRVVGHPEFGSTSTRSDGQLYMVVNGGGQLRLRFEKDGFLPAEREVHVPWQDYAWIDDVALVRLDPAVTDIDLSDPLSPPQIAQGSPVTDEYGTRQASLLFQPATEATMEMPDGSTQPLDELAVRATEYTVGDGGERAMPAELPPQSGFTYAAEFSVDQALEAGAREVRFSRPVISYTENFLDFPVGGDVPAGYYDRGRGHWVPSQNGRVVRVLSTNEGRAALDVDGSGSAASELALAELDIGEAELGELARLYSPGETLWRVPISHFTPWDFNWPYGPPPGAFPPEDDLIYETPVEDCCERAGSIVQAENQTLAEQIPIAGTPFSLRYQSDRVPGRRTELELRDIPLTGADLHPELRSVQLEIAIAGREHRETFDPAPNLTYDFRWDGRDVFGRHLRGSHPVTIRVGHTYGATRYQDPAEFERSFARLSGASVAVNLARSEATLWQTFRENLGEAGGWDARAVGLGGWTLDVHDAYDPLAGIVYQGAGGTRRADARARQATLFAGGGFEEPVEGGPALGVDIGAGRGIDVGPDGSLYVARDLDRKVSRIDPAGRITTVAGTGEFEGPVGDGGPATEATLSWPDDVAVEPDGSLLIADEFDQRIRRVHPDGMIDTVAGTGECPGGNGSDGDGVPAREAILCYPKAVVSDGSGGFFTTGEEYQVFHVGPDGMMTRIAGTGTQGSEGDGGPARQAQVSLVRDLALGPDGSLYLADYRNERVRRIGPDGVITTVAGGGSSTEEGVPATTARLGQVRGVDVSPDGELFIAEDSSSEGGNRVLRVGKDGRIFILAGEGTRLRPGGPARGEDIRSPDGVAAGPSGELYVSQAFRARVTKLAPAFPGFTDHGQMIALPGGLGFQEFSAEGRHLRTRDRLTGAVAYEFSYNGAGLLVGVTDVAGNMTRIERDGDGRPLAIVGPFGQRTDFELDASGYLGVVDLPGTEAVEMSYTDTGLLRTLTDPRGRTSTFDYDADGRLIKDDNGAGGSIELGRTRLGEHGYESGLRTELGRSSRYAVERQRNGELARLRTNAAGLVTALRAETDGSRERTDPDGTTTRVAETEDPDFGMQAPVTTQVEIATPVGRTLTIETERDTTLGDPADPRSLTSMHETTVRNGHTSEWAFNADLRLHTFTSAAGRISTVEVDAFGRPVRAEMSGIEPAITVYDDHGRPIEARQDVRRTRYAYDERGRLAELTDALERTTSFDYDDADRLTRQTMPDGREIRFGYDGNGNLAEITPPSKPPHAFSYTTLDQTEMYTPPDVGFGPQPTRFSYNADRQVTVMERPGGERVAFGYDEAGRLSTTTQARGETRMDYDPVTGHLSAATAPGGERIGYAYDGFLPTGETVSGSVSGSVSRTYDDDLRIATEQVNGQQSIGFSYDADGLLTGAGGLSLTRSPENGLVTGTGLGQVTSSIAHNRFGEPEVMTTAHGGDVVYEETYTRDDLGRIVVKTERRGASTTVWHYVYDAAGRLESVTRNGELAATYRYDANGNRIEVARADASLIDADHDAQDRLSRQGEVEYDYTAAGDLRSKTDTSTGQVTTYEYDSLGARTGVTLPTGIELDYVIDAEGRRIAKRRDGELIQGFVYGQGSAPLAELTADGTIRSRFVYATRSNVPDYLVRNGRTYRVVTDQLGSPRAVVDTESGAVLQEIDYDEFGRVLRDTNPGFQPFGYAGGIYDPDTGLVRFGARDYDPDAGRWTTKDPIGFAGGDSNLYGYVVADPINLTDPSGLFFRELGEGIVESVKDPIGFGEELIKSNAGFWDRASEPLGGGTKAVREGAFGPDSPLLTESTSYQGGSATPDAIHDVASACLDALQDTAGVLHHEVRPFIQPLLTTRPGRCVLFGAVGAGLGFRAGPLASLAGGAVGCFVGMRTR